MRMIDAPVGPFLSKEGELCMKTEYIADWGFEAYIVRSGETYWGGAKTAKERNNLDVTPVDAVPVVRCAKCEHWVKNDDGQCVCALFDIANSYGEPVVTKPDDFCSYGKRKEGADNDT